MADIIAAKIAELQRKALTNLASYQSRVATVELKESKESSDESDDFVDDEKERTLFVAGLDDRVTEQLLYELFIHGGPIESVSIPKEKNGKNRSYGFVIFKHQCTIPYAMRIYRGVSLYRKNLTMKFKNSTDVPPMGKIWLPENPNLNKCNKDTTRDQIRSHGHGNRSRYDDTAEISGSLLRVGEDDWVKGSAGRIIVKEPPNHNRGRRVPNNTPYHRHDNYRNNDNSRIRDDRQYRINRRIDHRSGGHNRRSI